MTSIPPGFESLFAEIQRTPAVDGKPPEDIDGSEVREVTIAVTGWICDGRPLSAFAGVVECAAAAAGMNVNRVSVNPARY